MLTHESGAHPEYQRRVLEARETVETTVFGLGWPARHRVVPNSVTARWCREDGTARRIPALINARSAPLARLSPQKVDDTALRLQHPRVPLFTPIAPLEGAPAAWVDRAALYAGESALRMSGVMSAKRAVAELAG
ncbi:hypothetical protein FMUBM48_29010 [Nocardia cyriacigeorgica]|nr:hypothetical protein FMUBM48_29010 [Nocardia cyriacigeorgica]